MVLRVIHRTMTIPSGDDHEKINFNGPGDPYIGDAIVYAIVGMNLTQGGPPSYRCIVSVGARGAHAAQRNPAIYEGYCTAYHDAVVRFPGGLPIDKDQIIGVTVYGEEGDSVRAYVIYEELPK